MLRRQSGLSFVVFMQQAEAAGASKSSGQNEGKRFALQASRHAFDSRLAAHLRCT